MKIILKVILTTIILYIALISLNNDAFASEKIWEIDGSIVSSSEEEKPPYFQEIKFGDVVYLRGKTPIPVVSVLDKYFVPFSPFMLALPTRTDEFIFKLDGNNYLVAMTKSKKWLKVLRIRDNGLHTRAKYLRKGGDHCVKLKDHYVVYSGKQVYIIDEDDDCEDIPPKRNFLKYTDQKPYITLKSAIHFDKSIDSFYETTGGEEEDDDSGDDHDDRGSIYYQVSIDNGVTWKYFDGRDWVDTDKTDGFETMTASAINSNIYNLSFDGGDFKWRAYLVSTGFNKVELDKVKVIYDTNVEPTDVFVGESKSISIRGESNSLFAKLTTVDENSTDKHIYTLVEGEGDEDNNKFSVEGLYLTLNFTPNFYHPTDMGDGEKNNSYTIRVQTDDQRGGTYQDTFIIRVIEPSFYDSYYGEESLGGDGYVVGNDLFIGSPCHEIIRINQDLIIGDIDNQYSSHLEAQADDVLLLQMHLKRLGLYHYVTDGIFGINVFNAVKKIQSYMKIQQTGSIDNRLRGFINNSCGFVGASLGFNSELIENYIGDNYVHDLNWNLNDFNIEDYDVGSLTQTQEANGSNNNYLVNSDSVNSEDVEYLENPFEGEQCQANQIIRNFMKKGNKDGEYSSYNKGIIGDINILQAHMNRLLLNDYGLQASGPVDGIFGNLTERGVKRLQIKLNQLLPNENPLKIDGIVGPRTRSAINFSC